MPAADEPFIQDYEALTNSNIKIIQFLFGEKISNFTIKFIKSKMKVFKCELKGKLYNLKVNTSKIWAFLSLRQLSFHINFLNSMQLENRTTLK